MSNSNNHPAPDYESPPRKRRLSDLHDNSNTRTWLEGFGMSANNDEVIARTPRKPKVPCVGFEVTNGVTCTQIVHMRSDTDGFPVCARHASRNVILALKVNAVFERWSLGSAVKARHPTDPNIFRKASGHIARTACSTRSRRPGFFYLFERTDVSPPVLKFGVDFCEHDDDAEGRIVAHETTSCRAEIDHHAVSGHFADAGLYDHVVNMLLEPAKEQIICPCGKNHREYFTLGQYAVQTGTGLWKLFREIAPIVEGV
ncbi:hypothetical protein HDU86_007872 [Geranomyces michiganensis]|nr:hypothetical protein HDU86_007872 [Geranomyces michiganensis]